MVDANIQKSQHAWLSNLGINELNEMQQQAVEHCDAGENVVLLSPTGSGKTLAYLLPLCLNVSIASNALQAIVVLPTRELAQQSEAVLKQMKTEIRALSLHGGRPAMNEHRLLKETQPHIIFTTPGRLNDHIRKNNISTHFVTTLVLDEFDKCLEFGFLGEMQKIITACRNVQQYLFTSATFAEEARLFLEENFKHTAKPLSYLNFLEKEKSAEQLQIKYLHSPSNDKLESAHQLLSLLGGAPTILFVAHRESAERVGKSLKEKGFYAVVYHGGMEQEHREKALYKFRNGSVNILVATDLAARGLDIPEVEAVIHYHLPANKEAFVHRTGRTARWDACGTAYLMIGPKEVLPEYATSATEICVDKVSIRPTRPQWTTIYVGKGKKDKISKMDIVGLFCKRGGLVASEIGRIDVGQHFAFVAVKRNKLQQLLRNICGEKIKGVKTIIEEVKN